LVRHTYLFVNRQFRYADKADVIMLIIGAIGSIIVGISFPLNLLIVTEVVNGFVGPDANIEALKTMDEMLKWYILLASITLAVGFAQMFCFSLSSKRQSRRIRLKLFKQMLRQDASWFDRQSMGDLITKMTSQVDQIEAGIGDRLGRFLQNLVLFISCFGSAFQNQWKMALVGLSTTPVIVIAFVILGVGLSRYSTKEEKAYSRANSIASEVLSSIRTVFAFIGQEKESTRYDTNLGAAARVSFKKNIVVGFGNISIPFFLHLWKLFAIFASAGLTFWYGAKLMFNGEPGVDGGKIVSVVLAFLVGSIALGLVLPEFTYFARAVAAAKSTFWVIERASSYHSGSANVSRPRLR
uniref:ABC transmembrane type-1 domain-containing protein n=1 Tax=Hydatigena taeniaeformis TaxID=6205 RepID=A0A0R3XBH1_HYDTA